MDLRKRNFIFIILISFKLLYEGFRLIKIVLNLFPAGTGPVPFNSNILEITGYSKSVITGSPNYLFTERN